MKTQLDVGLSIGCSWYINILATGNVWGVLVEDRYGHLLGFGNL